MTVDHDAITKVMTSQGAYGTGVTPNPYAQFDKEWARRKEHSAVLDLLQAKIVSIFEARFITPPSTAEAIAALVTLTDSRSVLELGTCTGFTTYHILKALAGKQGARIVTVDPRPSHDAEFFSQFSSILTHVNGWTPNCLKDINGPFDLVFVDSDHTVEHTAKELDALMPLTFPGSIMLFHDVPEWRAPNVPIVHPVRDFLLGDPRLRGLCLPSGEQADCLAEWGEGYDKRCNPGLGVFVRL